MLSSTVTCTVKYLLNNSQILIVFIIFGQNSSKFKVIHLKTNQFLRKNVHTFGGDQRTVPKLRQGMIYLDSKFFTYTNEDSSCVLSCCLSLLYSQNLFIDTHGTPCKSAAEQTQNTSKLLLVPLSDIDIDNAEIHLERHQRGPQVQLYPAGTSVSDCGERPPVPQPEVPGEARHV